MSSADFNPLVGREALLRMNNDSHAAAFENTAVKTALKLLDLGDYQKPLQRLSKSRFGHTNLLFSLFNELFPEFPMTLYASTLRGEPLPGGGQTPADYRVHMDTAATEPCRFFSYSKVVFVQVYQQRLRHAPKGVAVGLVFPRVGFRTGMLLHNDSTGRGWSRGGCFCYKLEKGEVFLQPFASYLSMYKESGWAPSRPPAQENYNAE